jgi:hypothetical protein
MEFETVNQNQVTFVSRRNRSSKYDELFLSLKALDAGKCIVIKIEENKSINKIKQNITQALRNHQIDFSDFKISTTEDMKSVVILRKNANQ